MNDELFERLLYEEEGPTLDFKREQYRFASASDEEKAELLKDILGFANAWRRSEAYILIGVGEVRGGRSMALGISAADHLDDHSLQQFVNSKTNRPVLLAMRRSVSRESRSASSASRNRYAQSI
ncbi:MAG: AlbA family DNA-binding domain-containing protein [Candidatus Rokuibacteriota bacterium]